MKVCEEREILTFSKSEWDQKQALLRQKTRKNDGFDTNTHKITASEIKKYQFITPLLTTKSELKTKAKIQNITKKSIISNAL